jgi:hypothetical protein
VINKVHLITDGNFGPTYVTTRCGLEGWREGADEYSTSACNRFEAVKSLKLVTCKRCIRSAKPSQRAL